MAETWAERSARWDREGTPTLEEFLPLYEDDDNVWWAIGCGHHQNLFDDAVDQLRDATEGLEAEWRRRQGLFGPDRGSRHGAVAQVLAEHLVAPGADVCRCGAPVATESGLPPHLASVLEDMGLLAADVHSTEWDRQVQHWAWQVQALADTPANPPELIRLWDRMSEQDRRDVLVWAWGQRPLGDEVQR